MNKERHVIGVSIYIFILYQRVTSHCFLFHLELLYCFPAYSRLYIHIA